MTEKKVFTMDLDGKSLVVEFGELAKQASAAVLVRYEDTAVLSVSQVSKKESQLDFFPLMVMYTEKQYAAGKIPGGFFKREGRPSEVETLTARLIDRPIRPLFPDGYKYDIQIINTVLSGNVDRSPQVTAMFGSSLSLSLTEAPFSGPIAGVDVGRVDGEFVLNPSEEEKALSDIDLFVAGTKDAINMVEAGALEVSEEAMVDAIMFGHGWIQKLVDFQTTIVNEVAPEKAEFTAPEVDATLDAFIRQEEKAILAAAAVNNRHERGDLIGAVLKNLEEKYTAHHPELSKEDLEAALKTMKSMVDDMVKKEVRRLIIDEEKRPDGRGLADIRSLNSQIDILERTHGSALFTRGETQALSITTLGALREHQIIDGLGEGEEYKRFMLHYNFPAYSVGENGRYGPPGRREIGHGVLGERALYQVLPSEEDFPYTIRIVSEILESNGSTSQASICAGCMSLMAAGVPLKAPVAGIAMGLVSDGKSYKVLSDIQGLEDHLGDMDFKVAGSEKGITALQMDIKIEGLSKAILEEALAQAKLGRLHILKNMLKAIAEPRKELSKYAPKVKMMFIDPDKIRDVVGPGGKIINGIIEKCDNIKIDLDQDGRVTLMHSRYEPIEKAISIIEEIVKVAKIGEEYDGKVVRIEKFGCFVELWPGTDGLCHISKLAHSRVNRVEDVVKLGQALKVKVIGIDERGRIDLSHKALLPRPDFDEKSPSEANKE
jgi:polyribonucleotide nucleotidyltransferase